MTSARDCAARTALASSPSISAAIASGAIVSSLADRGLKASVGSFARSAEDRGARGIGGYYRNSFVRPADTGAGVRMGQVMTKLTLWNNTDLDNAERGLIPRDAVRTVEIEALVDTGASTLVLPQDVVDALGLTIFDHLPVRLADGKGYTWPVAGSLRISILGRGMQCDAYVAPAGAPVLIGQIPLERLDLIVDPRSQEVRVRYS